MLLVMHEHSRSVIFQERDMYVMCCGTWLELPEAAVDAALDHNRARAVAW